MPLPALGADPAAHPRGRPRAVDQLAAEVEQDPVGALVPGFQRLAWVAGWTELREPVAERRVEGGVGLLASAVLRAGAVPAGGLGEVGGEVAQRGRAGVGVLDGRHRGGGKLAVALGQQRDRHVHRVVDDLDGRRKVVAVLHANGVGAHMLVGGEVAAVVRLADPAEDRRGERVRRPPRLRGCGRWEQRRQSPPDRPLRVVLPRHVDQRLLERLLLGLAAPPGRQRLEVVAVLRPELVAVGDDHPGDGVAVAEQADAPALPGVQVQRAEWLTAARDLLARGLRRPLPHRQVINTVSHMR
jgi:hypothetical protein